MATAAPPRLSARDLELASTVRMSIMRLARRLRNQRADRSLGLSQLAVLATLDRHGPMTPGQLAEHEKVRPPSMTRGLATLEQRGLVARGPHPTDGRASLVRLTGDALAMLAADRRRRDAWLAQRLADLSEHERRALREAAPVLERLMQA